MSWLATAGKDILKGVTIATAIAEGVDPFIQGTALAKPVQAITSELATVGNLATIVESTANAIGTATGPQKLAAVLPYVSSLIQASELMAGKHIQDEAGFEDGCSDVINGVVKILNSAKAQSTQATSAQPPAPPAVPAVKK